MENIEVVVSFDTTGSMYPCITQVRRVIKEMVASLFRDIPNIRIGSIAMGDYCDGPKCITLLPLSSDQREIEKFVTTVEATSGGDAPECYELALNQARTAFRWTAGAKKILILIGDDVPHEPNRNPGKLDWRNELNLLVEAGIKVYPVQALSRSESTRFYAEVAKITKGIHITLDQFNELHYLISAVIYQQQGEVALDNFQKYITKYNPSRSVARQFDTLRGKKVDYEKEDEAEDEELGIEPKDTKLVRVPAGRFQVMEVVEDCRIDDFVRDNGLIFEKGNGYYQFTKSEEIQSNKEIILREKRSGRFYTGDIARKLIGIPIGKTVKAKPVKLEKYNVFVQSNSMNRKLKGGTKFLYAVNMTR